MDTILKTPRPANLPASAKPHHSIKLLCVFLPACTLRAGIVLAASVCVSVRTKSRKLPVRNRCKLVGICPAVNVGSDWKLVTSDLYL